MRMTVEQARGLVDQAMQTLGYDAAEARTIADHLIDCELRGVTYGGLARAVSIAERVRCAPASASADTRRQGDASLRVNRRRRSHRVRRGATGDGMAIEKASASGIAIVGASNTWYTGMLSYYAEMAAARGLVSIIASNASPWVAPHGATEGRFGTNPICVGFPSADEPVIWDIGTSAIMHAEVKLAEQLVTDS